MEKVKDRKIIKKVTKKPRETSKYLQATLALANVSVHDSTIGKKLTRMVLVEGYQEENHRSPTRTLLPV